VAGCTCPRGKVSYSIRFRDGDANRHESAGHDLKAAQAKLRKIEVAVDEGDSLPAGTLTFADWGTQWLASLERPPKHGRLIQDVDRLCDRRVRREAAPEGDAR
jgi:hypothetical protein